MIIIVILVQSVMLITAIQTSQVNAQHAITDSNSSILDLSKGGGHADLPQIAASGNNVYVVWHDAIHGVVFKRSTDNGASFENTINLSNSIEGSIDPEISVSGNNVYVVWEHTPENNGEIIFKRSTDNGVSFGQTINVGSNTGLQGFPQIAASGNNVYVVWHDAIHGVVFKRSTDNGVALDKRLI